MEEDFKEMCLRIGDNCLELGKQIKAIMKHGFFNGGQEFPDQHGEMKANIMLAYRHMEDLRMRLEKAIQAYDGRISVYPR